MAHPFKRSCIQATRRRIPPLSDLFQRQPIRTITSTPSRTATEITTSNTSEAADDAYLDQLASQPGVKYTSTEEDEGLSKINVGDLSSMAHRELEQHRELREMVRLAAWEMPLLSQLSKPFERPRRQQLLRWRYTTYMGEAHPASRKVVVEFKPHRLTHIKHLQLQKLLKLAGPRYNPSTETIKMSCESFETQAQNKRYLADTISKLIAESTDPDADTFADVPLDTRHHKPRIRHQFPESWNLTPERKAELEEARRVKMLEEGQRVEENMLVSGIEMIQEAAKIDVKKVEEPMMVEARQPLAQGKMGRKEMGQQRGANR